VIRISTVVAAMTASMVLVAPACGGGQEDTAAPSTPSRSVRSSVAVQATSSTAPSPTPRAKDAVQPPLAEPTPLARWQLNDTSGLVVDEMGNYPGTIRGTVYRNGSFYDFPGESTDYVSVNAMARRPAGSWSNGWTLEAWCRFDTIALPNEQAIIKWNTGTGGHASGIFLDEPSGGLKVSDPPATTTIITTVVTTGIAYHVVWTATPNGGGTYYWRMWLNGVQATNYEPAGSYSSSALPPTVDGVFTLGGEFDQPDITTNASPLDGRIYKAAVYDVPLTTQVIQAHYAAGPG
jgi:hypothetical protein